MNQQFFKTRYAAAVLLLFATSGVTGAAELQLRAECRAAKGLVTLGDIAEVFTQDAAEADGLRQIDLMPAPPPGESRTLRLREIQDLLSVRGINLAKHRFSGASQVALSSEATARTQAAAPDRPVAIARFENLAKTAIARYLKGRAGDGVEMDVTLSDEQARAISQASGELHVEGGASPWHGKQQFLITAPSASGPQRVAIEALVKLPPSIVVATATLPRGTILRASDVRLQPGKPAEGKAQVYQTLDDVIGKETTRPIAPDQILDDQIVRRPVLVKRGEIVTVHARSGALDVRTTARARDDGGVGDVITVESISDRSSYFARVRSAQECDVDIAKPASVSNQPAVPASTSERRPLGRAMGRAALGEMAATPGN